MIGLAIDYCRKRDEREVGLRKTVVR